MKKPKISDFFHALFKNLWDEQKKNKFLLFFNCLKTENRKNSEKNYTNVSLDGRCRKIFRKNFYSKVKLVLNTVYFLENVIIKK